MEGGLASAEYHSKDFEWEDLKRQVENDSALSYHLLPPEKDNKNRSSHSAPQDSQAWQTFHRRHSSGKFFKERRYLLKEFPELVSSNNSKVLEVGCGSGSTALSLLRGNEKIVVYACDCSTEALERAKEVIDAANISSVCQRFHPFCCDFSTSNFPKWLASQNIQQNLAGEHNGVKGGEENNSDVQPLPTDGCCIGGVDFVTLIFTLSAVPLERMPAAIERCFSVLKPGGLLLFRDYGLYDMTMLRFDPDQRIGYREYMRSDGTRSYFFCLDTVRDLFATAGFIQLELEYCCIKAVNRRNGKSMQRVWVHGKFKRP